MPNKTNAERLISVKTIREEYGISKSTIERLVAAGKLHKHKIPGGRKVFYKEQELINLIQVL